MYHVYILVSLKNNWHYTGSTSDLPRRIKEHNAGKSSYDKLNRPFKLVYSEQFDTRAEAVQRERYLKTGRGRDFLKDLGL